MRGRRTQTVVVIALQLCMGYSKEDRQGQRVLCKSPEWLHKITSGLQPNLKKTSRKERQRQERFLQCTPKEWASLKITTEKISVYGKQSKDV